MYQTSAGRVRKIVCWVKVVGTDALTAKARAELNILGRGHCTHRQGSQDVWVSVGEELGGREDRKGRGLDGVKAIKLL